MSKRILVTSCKGGVGKSTVAANLAHALCMLGERVLLVDMDLGNRSLDLVLGCEDRLVYDISDICSSTVKATEAVIEDSERKGLFFVGAPYMYEGGITVEKLKLALQELEAQIEPTYTILDTSGGADISVELSAKVAETALIVTSRNPSSIRAAGKSAALLDSYGVKEQKLIINCFETNKEDLLGRVGVLEMIDETGLMLLGIIPRDKRAEILQEKGRLCTEDKRAISKNAFFNTAKRLRGERVKLLFKVKGIKEKLRRRIIS